MIRNSESGEIRFFLARSPALFDCSINSKELTLSPDTNFFLDQQEAVLLKQPLESIYTIPHHLQQGDNRRNFGFSAGNLLNLFQTCHEVTQDSRCPGHAQAAQGFRILH